MSKSNLQIYLHIVFSTKNRRHSIYPEVEKALYPLIWKKIKELNCEPLAVNGMADHIHILLKFDGRREIPELVKRLKGSSSKFINDGFEIPAGFKWQRGYGIFSVSPKDVTMIHTYIKKQKEHHNHHSIKDEYEI